MLPFVAKNYTVDFLVRQGLTSTIINIYVLFLTFSVYIVCIGVYHVHHVYCVPSVTSDNETQSHVDLVCIMCPARASNTEKPEGVYPDLRGASEYFMQPISLFFTFSKHHPSTP